MSGGGLKTMGRASIAVQDTLVADARAAARTGRSMRMACPAAISATPARTAAESGRPTACQAFSHGAGGCAARACSPRTIAARASRFKTAQRPREVGQRVVRRRRYLVQRPGERIPQGSRHPRRAVGQQLLDQDGGFKNGWGCGARPRCYGPVASQQDVLARQRPERRPRIIAPAAPASKSDWATASASAAVRVMPLAPRSPRLTLPTGACT